MEIKQVVFDMHSLKSPRPDGAPPIFFKKFWDSIRPSISRAVFQFFGTDVFSQGLNETFITLIPKVGSPIKVNHFHPISLCNTSYKMLLFLDGV